MPGTGEVLGTVGPYKDNLIMSTDIRNCVIPGEGMTGTQISKIESKR